MSHAASRPWLPVVELLIVFAGYAALLRAPMGVVYGTPLLILVSLLQLRRAGLRLDAMGLTRSRLGPRTVLRGVGLACVLIVVAWWVLRPLCEALTHATLDSSKLREAVAEPSGLALMLVMSWTFAGFGEEWVFRGYPLTRLAALGPCAQWVGLLASSVLFGWAHDYQGPAGMLLTGAVGFALGAVYLRSGRNLWLNIIAHGVTDTIAMLLFHFGLI